MSYYRSKSIPKLTSPLMTVCWSTEYVYFLDQPSFWTKKKVYDIVYSQAVTHPSTNTTRCCLTSVIKRELVLSIWYGRRHWLIIRSIALANMYVFICFKSKWLQLFVKLNFEQLWMGQGETQQPRVPVWVSSGIAPVSDWRLLAHLK